MKLHYKLLLITTISLAVIFVLKALSFPIQQTMYSFLSPSKPINAEVLVIEGWLSECMLGDAAREYLHGNYSYCLISGKKDDSPRSPVKALIRYGIDSSAIKFTEAKMQKGYNTFHMAHAAHEWFQTNDPKVSKINAFTAGPHSRKSWVIFKRVFGNEYEIGVLSASLENCNTQLWWKSKQGVHYLLKYGLGYLYALVWPLKT